ncbi:hypothetical protein [Burkholderia gladioli]|nr:hypothetical protein [Burkholderia gladioli]MDN7806575.1 hypothetical protein [Burkholderia gladioli]
MTDSESVGSDLLARRGGTLADNGLLTRIDGIQGGCLERIFDVF